jgi:hypothetical protein
LSEEVTEFSNNLGVAKFPHFQGPILKVFPEILPKLRVSEGLSSVVQDVVKKVTIYSFRSSVHCVQSKALPILVEDIDICIYPWG